MSTSPPVIVAETGPSKLAMSAPPANNPSAVISRPTSAALFVRYFKHIPASGLYVFKTSVAIGAAGVEADCVEGVVSGLDLLVEGDDFGNVYFVVIRV